MRTEIPKSTNNYNQPNGRISVVVGDLLDNVQDFIKQEALLIKEDIKSDLEGYKKSVVFTAGMWLALLWGGFWLSLFLVFFLIEVAKLPTWASCGIMGIILCAGGAYGVFNKKKQTGANL